MARTLNGSTERVRILERAVANLGDSLKRHDDEFDEELRDILKELKAIKLFLARMSPDFKKQFAEIQRKV